MTRKKTLDKFLQIHVAEVGYSTKIKDPDHTKHYHVYIFKVGLIPFLIGKAYHRYDMLIPIRIPGWKQFIAMYSKLTGAENRTFQPADWPAPRWRDKLVGWEYQQDLRCYELSLHGRHGGKSLRLDLTEEQYLKLRSKEMQRLDERE